MSRTATTALWIWPSSARMGGCDELDPEGRAVGAPVEAFELGGGVRRRGRGARGNSWDCTVAAIGVPGGAVAVAVVVAVLRCGTAAEHAFELAVAGDDAVRWVASAMARPTGTVSMMAASWARSAREGVGAGAQVGGGLDQRAGDGVDLGDGGADGLHGLAAGHGVAGHGEPVERGRRRCRRGRQASTRAMTSVTAPGDGQEEDRAVSGAPTTLRGTPTLTRQICETHLLHGGEDGHLVDVRADPDGVVAVGIASGSPGWRAGLRRGRAVRCGRRRCVAGVDDGGHPAGGQVLVAEHLAEAGRAQVGAQDGGDRGCPA